MTFWIRFGLIAFAVAAIFLAGHKVARLQCQADKAEVLRKAEEARKVDESFSQGISAGYENVAAQLRRISVVNRVEVQRETSRIEYRCELPATGERLRLDRIDSANAAIESGAVVRPDPKDSSEGSGRTPVSISGPGDDVH